MISVRFLRALLLPGFLILVLFNNCSAPRSFKKMDTVLGNPMQTVSSKMSKEICGVISRCFSDVDLSQCQIESMRVPGFNEPLGIDSQYTSLATIQEAEQRGLLLGSFTTVASCLDSISQQTCETPQVKAAYDANSSSPFAGIVKMVSGQSCGQSLRTATEYMCSKKVFLLGQSNSSLKPSVLGGGFVFSISPALPSGLSIDSNTGEISGTPTAPTPLIDYLVSAKRGTDVIESKITLRTAEGYRVQTLEDSVDTNPGNRICASTLGSCTLRAAVMEINASTSPNVILLPAGVIALNGTELLLVKPADIYGDCESKTTIDGKNLSRILHISAGGITNLNDLVIENGKVANMGGAGLLIDQATSATTVNIKDTIFRLNTNAANLENAFKGGAILIWPNTSGVKATVNISGSVFEDNKSLNSTGGAIYADWESSLNISDSSFTGNSATHGGAIAADSDMVVSRSSFNKNNALSGWGGAIWNTSTKNSFVTNATFFENSAEGGGAIASGISASSGVSNIINSTFVRNKARSKGYGGASYGEHRFLNSLMALNSDLDGSNNCGGFGTSSGNNLSDTSPSDCNFIAAGDKANAVPLLGSFQNNGGHVSTISLLLGSPGLDQGRNAGCPLEDARGLFRPANGMCDIGAYEEQ